MSVLAILAFWACAGVVAWVYAGYPLLVALLADRFGDALEEPDPGREDFTPPITVVVAAYDEQARIGARIRDILAQDYPSDLLRVLVVSDGSSDRTAQAARDAADGDPRVEVLELPCNRGKATALNMAMERVHTPVVVFADARQRYAPHALRRLAAPFADPGIGSVSGELVIEDVAAVGTPTRAVGLYWRMERRLRADESRLEWLHGVSGAIHAVRRDCFRPLPPGTILDDMWIPLQVAFAGHRVWMARDAIAIDRASATPGEEFARKLRTLAGNWQLIARMPTLLHPRRNPLFFAWFSHKFLRLLAPWALLLALAASAVAPGPVFRVLFVLQVLGYACAALGVAMPRFAARMPLLPAAGAFVLLNLAALLSLPASLAPDASRLWRKH
ncbi:glycosyltransferase family 2 protein [Luteimonas lutimaris]|uniref:Glycosyltransferase family 2 protein n=1 Tax=Luteimonas lutimaris TaxID=698645 RepID=A0ABP7MHD9_9GAMM